MPDYDKDKVEEVKKKIKKKKKKKEEERKADELAGEGSVADRLKRDRQRREKNLRKELGLD